jgi:hypothetical protein
LAERCHAAIADVGRPEVYCLMLTCVADGCCIVAFSGV